MLSRDAVNLEQKSTHHANLTELDAAKPPSSDPELLPYYDVIAVFSSWGSRQRPGVEMILNTTCNAISAPNRYTTGRFSTLRF